MSDLQLLTPSMMATYLVKFYFKDGQLHLIPKGIPNVERNSVREMDNRHMEWAIEHGLEERAEIGRHRPGRVDTGDPMNLTKVRITLDPSLHLVGCHQHYQAGQLAEGRHKEKKSIRVVTLCYTRLAPEKPFDLDSEVVKGLQSLQERAWQVCDIWSNPNGMGTLNFKGLDDELPESAVSNYTLGTNKV